MATTATKDFQMKVGKEFADLLKIAAEDNGMTRSAWADEVLGLTARDGICQLICPAILTTALAGRKSHRILLRLSEETYDAIQAAATGDNLKLSEWVLLALASDISASGC